MPGHAAAGTAPLEPSPVDTAAPVDREPAADAASEASTQPALARRRRRLWELPAVAHDVLLGLAVPGDALRRLVSTAISRLRRTRCRIEGADSDLLYSVVHDLTSRNAVSEAIERHLEVAFAAEWRAARALRDPDALQAWWEDRRAAGNPIAAAWAVLSHPQGASLESRVLFDLRTWAWTSARRAGHAEAERASMRDRLVELQAALERHQARCLELQRSLAERDREWQVQRASLVGELARWRDAAQHGAPDATGTPPRRPPADGAWPRADRCAASDVRPLRSIPRRWLAQAAAPPPNGDDNGPGGSSRAVAASTPAVALPSAPALQAVVAIDGPAERAAESSAASRPPGRAPRVLCVGGVPRAVSRYRERVERLGACFEHHDGGVEAALPLLDGLLGRADLVVCQAGCLNHEAYHRIKRHCARQGTACVFLERPSLACFSSALDEHLPALAARVEPRGARHG
jgi:hypothetical protein